MWTAQSRQLIRGSQAHIAAGLGAGADYIARYEELKIWFEGFVEKTYRGVQGGNWLWIKDKQGISWQFAHLDSYRVKVGDLVNPGKVVAVTGNTGIITTGPHLHIQAILNGSRIDPEKYIKLTPQTMDKNRQLVKMTYLAYGLAPTSKDVDYWAGQSDERILNDLPYELCKQVDPDGSASTRVDYFNKLSKKSLNRDLTTEEQNTFSNRREPLRGVTDYILSK